MLVIWLKFGDLRCSNQNRSTEGCSKLKRSVDMTSSNNSFEFLRILIWFTPLLEYAVSQYFWRPCLIYVSSVVRRIDRGLVEHLVEPAMNWCLYGFCESLESNKYTTNRVCRLFDLVQRKWEQISGCPAPMIQNQNLCRVSRKRVKSKFLYQDAYVIPLADKCIVVRSFVCGNYEKVPMGTGKFSGNLRVT